MDKSKYDDVDTALGGIDTIDEACAMIDITGDGVDRIQNYTALIGDDRLGASSRSSSFLSRNNSSISDDANANTTSDDNNNNNNNNNSGSAGPLFEPSASGSHYTGPSSAIGLHRKDDSEKRKVCPSKSDVVDQIQQSATSFLQESATVTSCALGKLEEAAVCASEHLVVMREVAESLAETIEVVADDGLVLHDRVKALCSKMPVILSFAARARSLRNAVEGLEQEMNRQHNKSKT